jgi:hypothetical protein
VEGRRVKGMNTSRRRVDSFKFDSSSFDAGVEEGAAFIEEGTSEAEHRRIGAGTVVAEPQIPQGRGGSGVWRPLSE